MTKAARTTKQPNGTAPTSTVGRNRPVTLEAPPKGNTWTDGNAHLFYGDSLDHYSKWGTPTTIVSDGAYGVLGFEGDTSDHMHLPEWYESHIAAWAEYATPQTSLWFWNSEIGWAAVHPVLQKYGWRYVNANVWNKGVGHIAGNVNTKKIRRFPVVTEVCVQYCFEAKVNEDPLKVWLLKEWRRTGLALRKANEACGVADAAVRKYLDQGHLWYFPPPEKFTMLADYANEHGDPAGRPYFSFDGKRPATAEEWGDKRYKFSCPHGVTNVWDRPALRGKERIRLGKGKAIHLNQKPIDLTRRILEASTNEGDVVWEPFGGLFTTALVARRIKRKAFAGEMDGTYFQYGVRRFEEEDQTPLPT
jgi:hypothetical protein